MKKRFKLIALVLCLAMIIGSVAACGNSESSTNTAAPAATEAAQAENSAQAAPAQTAAPAQDAAPAQTEAPAPAEDEEEEEGFEDIEEIKLCIVQIGNITGWPEVQDAINEITEREIGVRINMEWVELGSYIQQLNLKFSAAEPVDLITLNPLITFANMQSANQLMDITDLLDEEGQELKGILTDALWRSVTVNSRIYGVPTLQATSDSLYLTMRKDILEDIGMLDKALNIQTWSDYEEILAAVKEQHPELVPVFVNVKQNTALTFPDYVDVSGESFADGHGIDNLGDAFNLIYVDEETQQVKCYYTSDIFRKDVERAADFYSKGYLYKDGATTDDAPDVAMRDGISFSQLNGTADLGAEALWQYRTGIECVMIKIAPEVTTRFLLNMWGFAVPFTSRNPEAAVRYLNLLYQSEELFNLLMYGIEGRDYQKNADGTVTVLENAAYNSQKWLHGNELLAYPTEADGPGWHEEFQEVLDNQTVSHYLDFVCDTSSITNQLTACNNAKQEYAYALLSGSVTDWEKMYDEFMAKLDASGIQDILDCYQEQFDAFLAQK